METKDVIYELRTGKGLSQDELAKKVFVTRQAVSRWETGETVPNTETLEAAYRHCYDVSINTLLGDAATAHLPVLRHAAGGRHHRAGSQTASYQ